MKCPTINRISYVLHYFCYIVCSHCLLQEVLHISYHSTFLGSLGGISTKLFSFAVLHIIVIIAVVALLCIGIIHSDQGINPIHLTVGSTWAYP